ncbi:c-type cytochrome [Gelidibacter gilvus]|nr:cytochrome c [Gelidibacter gilvus]
MKKKSLITLTLIIVTLLIAVFITVVFGGVYNVGATDKHIAPIEWVFRKTMESSVRSHSKYINVPEDINLEDKKLARKFYGAYTKACQTCHGAPGRKSDPWMYIYPAAPDLTDKAVVGKWTDAELFWIIKNGIKDTGMPGLGPTHGDEEMWGVTAFVRQLPNISPEEYEMMEKWFKENGEGNADLEDYQSRKGE